MKIHLSENRKEKLILSISLICGILIIILFSCANKTVKKEEDIIKTHFKKPPKIRVLLLNNVNSFKLSIESGNSIKEADSGRLLSVRRPFKNLTVSPSSKGVKIGRELYNTDRILISPTQDGTIFLKGRRYRGELLILRSNDSHLSVVNNIDMERYLYGVIGSEMPLYWNEEALEAQAVAARTYAFWQMHKYGDKRKFFDVYDTVRSQVYLGMKRENSKARKIVDETRGLILTFGGELFCTYFHSTCGGHTESAEKIFGGRDVYPLSGVKCDYCKKSKYYRWKFSISERELVRKLKKRRVSETRIKSIKLKNCPSSRRGRTVVIIFRTGRAKQINANRFRAMIGYSNLRSTAFEAKRVGSKFYFSGRGWGHGVGLCQYGAKGMADEGFNFKDILEHYYISADIWKKY